MLLVTGVDKGYAVHIIISIVDGSRDSARRLTSNTELNRSHNIKNNIAAYRAQHQLDKGTPPPCNKRKHLASKDGDSLGSDIAPKDGSPLKREPAIRKRKPRSSSNNKRKQFEDENVNGTIGRSHVNDAIRHSRVNDAICRLFTALTLSKRELAEISHVLT